MKRYILLLAAFAIMGCSNPAAHQPKLDKEFHINFGQELNVQDENLNVQFKDLITDTRCPEGAACIWSGNAQITILINGYEVKLNTHLDPRIIDFSDYNIKLLSLYPFPKHNREINKKKYVAELLISRKQETHSLLHEQPRKN